MKKTITTLLLIVLGLSQPSVGFSQETTEDKSEDQSSLEMQLGEIEVAIQQKKAELDEITDEVSDLTSRLDTLKEAELDSLLKLYEREEQSTSELQELENELMDLQEIRNVQSQAVAEIAKEGQDFTIPEIEMEFVWIKNMDAWVGKYEVTNAEFRYYAQDHTSGEYEGYELNSDRQPAVRVHLRNFQDGDSPTELVKSVHGFAEWLTKREQKEERLSSEWKFRLPTSDEWAKIASCEDNRKYPWGDVWPPLFGNFDDETVLDSYKIEDYEDNWVVSCPVESSGCNDWSLCGVGGNVSEWTSDENEQGVVVRGASWQFFNRNTLESKFSSTYPPSIISESLGFRLILSR